MEQLSYYRVSKKRIEYGAIHKEWMSPERKQKHSSPTSLCPSFSASPSGAGWGGCDVHT
jgi:hypothetical protein